MVNLEENVSNAKKNTTGKLLAIESIFKWKPTIYEENLEELTCEFEPQSRNQFNLYNFIIRLVNCYKCCDDESALKIVDDLILAGNEFNEDGDGGYFKQVENAYYHMVYASKTFLLIRNNKHEEAAEIIEKIKPFDEMDDYNKAAIHAVKSAVFALYSNEDTQKAFASIDKALKLDERGLWYFLKGLYIRRIRRMTNPFESPSLCEKEQFEKAFEKQPSNVVFKLHLADVYREITKHASQRSDLCSHFLPKDYSLTDILKSKIDQKIHLAARYYKEAAEEFPECPYVMFRAADGLAKLPEGLNNIKLARKLTKEGLILSPENVCGNLVAAFLSEKFDKNIKDARKHLKICTEKSIFDADMNMIRILHMQKPEQLKGIEVLQQLMKKYKEKARHAILYSQMVSYYLFIKDNLIKANENAIHFYELNTGSSCMQTHRSVFIATPEPFSLIDVLLDEVKNAMDVRKNSKHLDEKPLENLVNSCKKFVQFINFQNIPIMNGAYQNFVKQILEGNPMKINEKCLQKPFKNKRGNFAKERVPQSTISRPNTSKKVNSDNNRNNQMPPRKAPNEIDLPSLMDIPIDKPAAKNVEEQFKEETPVEDVKCSEEKYDSSSDSKIEQMIRKIVKGIKKKKKSQPEGKNKSENEEEESIVELLKLMGLGGEKSTRGKKHRSDSDSESDSDYKSRKYHRRERSRRRHRSRSDSDDSKRHGRRLRRHKQHSTESDSSKSVRRKSHKKDRYERDYSSRERYHRRRHHSNDDDSDYKSTYRRDDRSSDRRRRRRRDSVSSRSTRDRSLSYEKRRRSSPKKYKSSRRSISPDERRQEREKSVSSRDSRDRSTSYDKRNRRSGPKNREPKIGPSEREETDKKSYEKKSRHRSSSRDKSQSRRNKNAKSKKEETSKTSRHRSTSPDERRQPSEREETDKKSYEKKSRRRNSSRDKPQSRGNENIKSKKEGESSKNTSKRDQNSFRRSDEESDS